MPEFIVGVISLLVIAGALALPFVAFSRTARHTAEAGPSLFGALGLLVAVFGFFVLVETQRSFDSWQANNPGASRWQVATTPLIVIALGLLVCIGAQILAALRDRDRSRGTHV